MPLFSKSSKSRKLQKLLFRNASKASKARKLLFSKASQASKTRKLRPMPLFFAPPHGA